jgi:hypothetical protein
MHLCNSQIQSFKLYKEFTYENLTTFSMLSKTSPSWILFPCWFVTWNTACKKSDMSRWKSVTRREKSCKKHKRQMLVPNKKAEWSEYIWFQNCKLKELQNIGRFVFSPSMNHPPSDAMYAFEIFRSRSVNTWTTSSRIPCVFALFTWMIESSDLVTPHMVNYLIHLGLQ